MRLMRKGEGGSAPGADLGCGSDFGRHLIAPDRLKRGRSLGLVLSGRGMRIKAARLGSWRPTARSYVADRGAEGKLARLNPH